ncbi:nitroreductase [Deinococcus taeanensis]|uniref:nitroreductase family protein n=1 Tax=Deinococcus taeanensis TaxID=2737050 RepID=UPI001CDBB6BE|nr:nitroreductase [Deinococcus taeanensis]UBV42292.1 nitroreductase [Deinococcus taeanensis]
MTATLPPTLSAQAQAVLDVIHTRRTVDLALLQPDPVPREVTEAILTAGTWAPTHGRTEPWRFTVFTGPGRAQLAEMFAQAYAAGSAPDRDSEPALAAQRARAWRAPLWISLELHMPARPKMPEWEEQAALACAAQNMLLAATAFGLAGKWVSGPVMISPVTAAALGAPKLLGLLYLGYPAGDRPASTRAPLSEKVTWVE